MKIVFMGTPEYSSAALEALIGAGHEVLAAVPAAVRSVTAVTFPDSDIQDRIYMLCDLGDGGSRVQVYDRAAKSLDIFSGTVYCTEIVLVR